MGVDIEGKRTLLGVSMALPEARIRWRTFLSGLASRRLHGVTLFVSDDHAGLKAARAAIFPSVFWQRCCSRTPGTRTHTLTQETGRRRYPAILDTRDEAEAKRLIDRFVRTYEVKVPTFAQ